MLTKIVLLLLIINKMGISSISNSLKQIEQKNRESNIQEKMDTFKEELPDSIEETEIEPIFPVFSGKVASIEIYEGGNRNTLKEKMSIPIKSGDILNIEKLDQALENLSLGNWNYDIHIFPSNKDVHSVDNTSLNWDIVILGERKEQNMLIGTDNSSHKDLGQSQWYTNLQYGDLLGLSDLWSFSSIDRITKSRSSNRETATNLSFEIPVKTFKIKYSLEHGYNKNKIESLSKYTIKSKVQSHRLTLQRLIHRDKVSRTNLISSFYLRDYNTTLNNLKLDVNSKRYSYVTLGLERLNFFQGGILYFLVEFEKGVPWFESEKNTKETKLSGYNMEYEKINFFLNWEKFIGDNFIYTLKSGGIYSEDRLLSINQFTTGDLYTVRGFKETAVNGNKAIYFNNTLSYEIQNLNSMSISPFIGADIGWSRDKDLNHSDNLIGIAIGVEVNYKSLMGKLTYGQPIEIPSGLKKESGIIYFSIQYNF